MVDAHIHIERGPYTIEWIKRFFEVAIQRKIDEVYLLEHSHRFIEFSELYQPIVAYNEYQKNWYSKKNLISIIEYLQLIEIIKKEKNPIKVKFGLEICFLDGVERIIERNKLSEKFDFLTGAVHWINNWGFDHKKDHWKEKEVNSIYNEYFKIQKRLISSGFFTIVAHPDSIKAFQIFPNYDLKSTYEEIALLAKQNNIKMEQSCGLKNNYNYPSVGLEIDFIKALKRNKVEIITASDAHKPEDVGRNIDLAERLLGNKICV